MEERITAKAINWLPVGRRGNTQATATAAETSNRWGFAELFVISQTAFPALLFLPGTQSIRLPLRVAPFAVSLAALAWMFNQRRARTTASHPATLWLVMVMIWLALMILHPTTNTTMAGTAQMLLYLSVLAPLFWAPGMVRQTRQLDRLLAILLVCNGVNSLVGVLQVYYPETWMPAEFSQVLAAQGYEVETALGYLNDAGRVIIRPPGLYDMPGAVCGAGIIAGFLGVVFFLRPLRLWQRMGSLGFAVLGVMAIYFSQVRTSLLILGGMTIVYTLILGAFQKRRMLALVMVVVAGAVGTIGYTSSSSVGGQAVSNRFGTLTEGDPLTVYYLSLRGPQLEYALTTLLPAYPAGAGLGRWGMMRAYFGNEANKDSPKIWAELQLPAWILDGGIVLVLLYVIALCVTAAYELRLARRAKAPELRECGAIILAVNLGVLAITFGFTPFTTQLGMQYWFLAGALYGAAQTGKRLKQ
ncbi:MAG: hypothetical protein ABI977_22915 [Acidobacteriota bacterium]